jgi:hypothetical protein
MRMEKSTWKTTPQDEPERRTSRFESPLTARQIDRLRSCANGISLRFDDPGIVAALIAGGYAERRVAGVITVTAKGHEFLSARAG